MGSSKSCRSMIRGPLPGMGELSEEPVVQAFETVPRPRSRLSKAVSHHGHEGRN